MSESLVYASSWAGELGCASLLQQGNLVGQRLNSNSHGGGDLARQRGLGWVAGRPALTETEALGQVEPKHEEHEAARGSGPGLWPGWFQEQGRMLL